MANPIVKIADMIGPVLIQQDDNTEMIFNNYRELNEAPFIRKLLGVELGNALIAAVQVDGTVPAGVLKTIYDPISTVVNGVEIDSAGMKEMLKCILYFHMMRDNNFRATLSGNINGAGENSTVNSDNFNLAKTYNRGVEIAKTIRYYISIKPEDYPTYKCTKPLLYATGL